MRNLRQFIRETIRRKQHRNLKEGSREDVRREILVQQFSDEQETNLDLIERQKRAEYDIYLFLDGLGFGYENNDDVNMHHSRERNFKPGPSDYVGSFMVADFIKGHREYLRKLSSQYDITDQMWNQSMKSTIIPGIERILSKYGLKLDGTGAITYGHGDMRIQLETPEQTVYGLKFPQLVMKNPDMLMSAKEFVGTEDRTAKRKFVRHVVDGVEYKFLLNPLPQDMYPGTGNKGFFGGLFKGMLDKFIGAEEVRFDDCLIQVATNGGRVNFVMGGDGSFYLYDEVQKFIKDENHPIEKYRGGLLKYLPDLKGLFEKLRNRKPKMVVFISGSTRNGGVFERNHGTFYPYVLF